ncbi:MAG: transketolase [DPANN group archaeon]|nr:transketolase [DPANN group archaeon]
MNKVNNISGVVDLKLMANTLRQDILKALHEAGSGHAAGALGMADIFTALYFNIANIDPGDVSWSGRDRIVLSNGHICPVLYAAMAHAGYFPVKELMTLRKFGGRLHGHPHNEALPGLENSSGPLGQGISIAAGMALAAKMKSQEHTVYCLMGDGEINEGQPWEAFMFSAAKKLDNLIVIIDRNYIQIDGNTEEVMPLDPLDKKFEAFNFHVIEIDGNDMAAVLSALADAKKVTGKPVCIIANTVPGKGVSFMERKHEWHGKVPDAGQLEKALEELDEERAGLEGSA